MASLKDHYFAQAAVCEQQAQDTALPLLREQRMAAAHAWREMAERAERTERRRPVVPPIGE